MSLVSVIVPIYNAARYLESCIGSIINSTYKNKSKNKFFHICSAYKFFSFSNSDSSMILKNPYRKACF